MTDLPHIAFIGKAGAGKDEAAALLVEHMGYHRIAFADKLKDLAATLWGEDARKDRDKLQRLGVAVREIDPDTWVNLAIDGGLGDAEQPVVITDCRFKNEAWALKGEGFITVRIVADRPRRIERLRLNGKLGPEGWENHISETDLDDWPQDYRVQNIGTKAELLDELARTIALDRGATRVP